MRCSRSSPPKACIGSEKRTCGAAAADSATSLARRSLQAPCCFSLALRNKPKLPSRGISRFPASTREAAWSRRIRRVGMRLLLELRAASAAVFGETRLRFQRPCARERSATCAAAAVAPRCPNFFAHGLTFVHNSSLTRRTAAAAKSRVHPQNLTERVA
jgi:hypothetical protein